MQLLPFPATGVEKPHGSAREMHELQGGIQVFEPEVQIVERSPIDMHDIIIVAVGSGVFFQPVAERHGVTGTAIGAGHDHPEPESDC